ncbi:MAG: SUF system NifU family Fe-S cluster assembly protein [Planctomycetes bacterium RBG_16_59_8]|nr:MAG: SUF system NifU family Fe-S cluster assembly protein [Planctomycetes bacterium RBG_16_59_8]
MTDIDDLYEQTILDHNRTPRNYGKLEGANRSSEGHNPLCGDHFHIYLKVENGAISDVRFEGAGCAISKASASIMSSLIKGKTLADAEALFTKFHKLVTAQLGEKETAEGLGKIAVFAGVCDYPVRVKCASLAWHTMMMALKEDGGKVCTE